MNTKKDLFDAPHTILTPKKGRFLKIKAIISKRSLSQRPSAPILPAASIVAFPAPSTAIQDSRSDNP
jgi:hypothetical protein